MRRLRSGELKSKGWSKGDCWGVGSEELGSRGLKLGGLGSGVLGLVKLGSGRLKSGGGVAFSNFTNGGWLPSLHPYLLRLGLCLFPHLSTTQLTSPPLFPHPQPVNTHLVHSPTPPPRLTPYSIPHLPLHMGANPGRMRDASPQYF